MTDLKRFSTLQAVAAIQGYRLDAQRTGEDGWSFALISHSTAIELPNLDDVVAWLSTNAGREAVNA